MTTNAGAPRSISRVLLRWLLRTATLTFALVVAAALAVLLVLPRATHGSAMTVLTGSMTPGIPVGSIVLVKPVDPASLRVGDVATYQKQPGKALYVTHRVAAIDDSKTPTRFTFKGDANRGPDLDPVVPGQIRGKVWFHVAYLGAIRDGLHGKGGFTLLATLLLAGYALSQVGAGMRERRSRAGRSSTPPVTVPVNRRVIVATYECVTLTRRLGLSPAETASSWGALLVHEDPTSCTMLLAPVADDVGAYVEMLHTFEPASLEVIDEPVALSTQTDGTPATQHPPAERRVDA